MAQSKTNKPVSLTKGMQLGFLVVAWSFWAVTLLSDIATFGNRSEFITTEAWITYAMQWLLLPLLVLIALPLVWRHYSGTTARSFIATFLGMLGLLGTYAFLSLEATVQYKWFLSLGSFDSSDVWNVLGHQWLVTVLSVAVYVGVLGAWEWRLKHRR